MSQRPDLPNRRKMNEFSVPPIKYKNGNLKNPSNLESFQTQSVKKSKEEYIQRVKNIYSPNRGKRRKHC